MNQTSTAAKHAWTVAASSCKMVRANVLTIILLVIRHQYTHNVHLKFLGIFLFIFVQRKCDNKSVRTTCIWAYRWEHGKLKFWSESFRFKFVHRSKILQMDNNNNGLRWAMFLFVTLSDVVTLFTRSFTLSISICIAILSLSLSLCLLSSYTIEISRVILFSCNMAWAFNTIHSHKHKHKHIFNVHVLRVCCNGAI